MKYTTSIVSLLLAAPSTILAAPSPASAPKVSAREPSHLSVRDYDGPQPACMGGKTHSGGIPIGSGFGWTVYIPQPIGLEDKPGFFCGDGFLDNLRGQGGCETPTSYGCDSMDVEKKSDGSIIQGIQVTFDSTIFCGTDQVANAIKAATAEHFDAHCVNQGNSGDTSPAAIANAILGAISGAAPGFAPKPPSK